MSTFGRRKAEHEPDETPDDPPGRRVTHLTRWDATVRVFYDLDVRTHRGFVRWGLSPGSAAIAACRAKGSRTGTTGPRTGHAAITGTVVP